MSITLCGGHQPPYHRAQLDGWLVTGESALQDEKLITPLPSPT
jgi:hypothetical protein